MLVQFDACGTPEEVDLDMTLVSDASEHGFDEIWFGQPLRLRGMLRNGTHLSVGLSLTECATVYMMLRADDNVRAWAEMMEARAASLEAAP